LETTEIITGAQVVDVDGERLGNVIAATDEYLVAEHGLFFPTDYYIPRNVIAKVEDATIWLTMTRDDVLAQGWSLQPNAESNGEEPPPSEQS
jgi:hypothetical protein